MATTKKTTRAKTNTSKRTTTKKSSPTKRATAAKPTRTVKTAASSKKTKVTKATPAKKPAVVKSAAAKAPRTKLSITQVLTRLNGLSAFLHVAGAVAAGVLIGNYTHQIVTGIVVKDELASGQETVFAPAIHHLLDLNLRWLVVVTLAFGVILPLVQLRGRKQYDAAIKAKQNALRWIDRAIVGSLMLSLVAVVSGVRDFMTLAVVSGLVVIAAVMGWVSERQNVGSAQHDFTAVRVGLFATVLPWLIILAYALATPVWGMIRLPWFVYALYGVMVVGAAAYTINSYNYVRRFRNWADYAIVERNSIIIDMVTRVSFVAILIIGLYR